MYAMISLILISLFLSIGNSSYLSWCGSYSGSNSDQYGIINMRYLSVYIDVNLHCYLKLGNASGLSISPETKSALLTIAGKSPGDCFGKDFTLTETRIQSVVDTRIDYPFYDDQLSDMMRARVLRCVDIDEIPVEAKTTCSQMRKSSIDIVRDTLDHYAGFTLANVRPQTFDVPKCDEMIGSETSVRLSDKRELYFSSAIIKDPLLDSMNRNLQFVVVAPVLATILTTISISSASSSVSEVSSSVSSSISAGTAVGILSLITSIIGTVLSNIKKSNDHANKVEASLTNLERDALETRKLYLIQMRNMIEQQIVTNEWLEKIYGRVDTIANIVYSIEKEVAEINAKLDEISDDIRDVIYNQESDIELPDLPIPDDLNQEFPLGKLTNPISDTYDSIMSAFDTMGCDTFKDFKEVASEAAFVLLYLDIKLGWVSKEDYRKYRFNSEDELTNTFENRVYVIGGRYPKFTIRSQELDDKINDWSKGKTLEDVTSMLKEMRVLFAFLNNRIQYNYYTEHILGFYSDIYMSSSHHNTSIYDHVSDYIAKEDLCFVF